MQWTRVAELQGGLISRGQLEALGIPSSTVSRWLRRGRLVRTPAAGVFRVGGAPAAPASPAWFAALSSHSPVSFVSAARWWEMQVDDDALVHITRFDRRRLDWPVGVRVHRVALTDDAVTRHRGLLVTTRAETVLDCMGWLSLGRARVLADRAVQQRWITMADVDRRLREQRGRWGNRQIRLLAPFIGDGADAESERRLQRMLRNANVTGWIAHLPFVAGGRRFEIDIAFPELKLAIEIDGYAYHSSDDRFQRDRTKQNALIAAGWRVLRFTWADLDDRPGYVLAQILQLLAA